MTDAILVDTHALLWFVFDDPRLSKRADEMLASRDVKKVFSVASLWEIAIKVTLGKLGLGMSYSEFLDECINTREIDVIGIRLPHLSQIIDLPMHHRDPFDRLLIAQAQIEKLPVLTADERFDAYGITRVW